MTGAWHITNTTPDIHKFLDFLQHLGAVAAVVGAVFGFWWRDRKTTRKLINDNMDVMLVELKEIRAEIKTDAKERREEISSDLKSNAIAHASIVKTMNDQHTKIIEKMLELHS